MVRALRTFALFALPFVLLEAGTRVVSLLTGLLSIPPVIWVGTVVDPVLLAVGLAVPIYRGYRITKSVTAGQPSVTVPCLGAGPRAKAQDHARLSMIALLFCIGCRVFRSWPGGMSHMVRGAIRKLGILGVDDYVDTVREVWTTIHTRRTVIDYALHVLDHASRLGEAVRLDEPDRILDEIAETANWLFGFVAKLNDEKGGWEQAFNIPTKLSRMVWGKYPGFCPHCFERLYMVRRGRGSTEEIAAEIWAKCRYCLADYPRVEYRAKAREYRQLEERAHAKRVDIARATETEIPSSLRELERMFHTIYESNVAISTPESIGFHILEETGEMARAVIDLYTNKPNDPKGIVRRRVDLCDEVAEVFAWLCSLTAKVRAHVESIDRYGEELNPSRLPGAKREGLAKKVGLEEILLLRHLDDKGKEYRCDYCRSRPCVCELTFAWERESAPRKSPPPTKPRGPRQSQRGTR